MTTLTRPLASTRRQFLREVAGTAALLAAAKAALPGGAFAQGAGPEVKGTKLGYIALTDASPLIIAKEKGFFDEFDLPEMDIAKQASGARRATTWRSVPSITGSTAATSCDRRCTSTAPAK